MLILNERLFTELNSNMHDVDEPNKATSLKETIRVIGII